MAGGYKPYLQKFFPSSLQSLPPALPQGPCRYGTVQHRCQPPGQRPLLRPVHLIQKHPVVEALQTHHTGRQLRRYLLILRGARIPDS